MEAVEEVRTVPAIEEESQWAMGQSVGILGTWTKETYRRKQPIFDFYNGTRTQVARQVEAHAQAQAQVHAELARVQEEHRQQLERIARQQQEDTHAGFHGHVPSPATPTRQLDLDLYFPDFLLKTICTDIFHFSTDNLYFVELFLFN